MERVIFILTPCYVLDGTGIKRVVINTSCSDTTCCSSFVRVYLCLLATPTNLKKERLFYVVTCDHDNTRYLMMSRHNGKIDGDT